MQKGIVEKRQITCPCFKPAPPHAQCNLNKHHVISLPGTPRLSVRWTRWVTFAKHNQNVYCMWPHLMEKQMILDSNTPIILSFSDFDCIIRCIWSNCQNWQVYSTCILDITILAASLFSRYALNAINGVLTCTKCNLMHAEITKYSITKSYLHFFLVTVNIFGI